MSKRDLLIFGLLLIIYLLLIQQYFAPKDKAPN